MKKLLWWVLGLIITIVVMVFLVFVWPGPQIGNAIDTLSGIAKNQAAVSTRDPAIDTLATGQVQQAQILEAMSTQIAKQSVVVLPTAVQVPPTADLVPTTAPAATLVPPSAANSTISNGWEINRIDVKNDPIVEAWLSKVKEPAPKLWFTFPNVPNPKAPDFQVANGAEYGMADSPFCEYMQTCDWVVPAWHYRLISGDYKFTSPKFSYSCQNVEGQARKGCLIVLFNTMNESFTWRNQSVDNGFTVMGRYWNGDELQWAVWGLTSHASANMLNLVTMGDTGEILNAWGHSANAGANCGVQPHACDTVDVMVIVQAGDRVLATMHTTVTE